MGNRITINGQHYDSPDAMPPDVRRLYEAALRTAASSLASGEPGESTQVFAAQTGDLGASVVVNRTVAVNNRTHPSADDLPPEARKLHDDALEAADPQAVTTHPGASFHVSVNFGGSRRTPDESTRLRPGPLPIEDSSLEANIRRLPVTLAILIGIALILWVYLGR